MMKHPKHPKHPTTPRVALPSLVLALALSACGSDPTPAPVAPVPSDGATEASPFDFAALDQALFGGAVTTEGVVVMQAGKIVHEKYAAGFDAQKRHLAYSVSKSVGSALLGVAVDERLLALEDSVCKYAPAPAGADPTSCDTTIASVVQMTSGLEWSESYDDPKTSNVLPMLYGDEPDVGLYMAMRPRAKKPGEAWKYSSGDSNLLARALKGALGGRDMRAWANEKLFVPAGLTSAIFESDAAGNLLFSSGVFMTTRDMARFGQLYLDDGMNGTTRVLSSSWVAFTHTPAPAVAKLTPKTGDGLDQRGGSYGASFWLNAATPDAPKETLLYADCPRDMFSAQGTWGQRIFIIPSRKLVIARVGNDRVGFYDGGAAVAAAVAAVDKVLAGAQP